MPEICPFLVANHDPDSVLNYPSEGNVCTKLGDPHPVATGHQASYCLRARYWFCPVYAGATKQPPTPIQFDDTLPVPPPKATRSRTERTRRSRRIRPGEALAALFLVTVVGVGGGLWYTAHNSTTIFPTASPSPSPSQTIAASPGTTPTASATVTFTSTPSPTQTPSSTVSPSDTPTPSQSATVTITDVSPTPTPSTPKPCVVPPDWQRYTVLSGETFYHIALKFGTTVDILQRVNCVADPQRVFAGQVLSVPPVTPTATH